MANTADGVISIDVLVTQDQFDEAMKELNSKLSQIAENTKKEVEKVVEDTRTIWQKFGDDLQKVGDDWQKAGKAITDVFDGTAKIAQNTTQAAMNWETAFTGVRKTVDATEQEFAQLQENIRGMSMEIPVDTTDLANMMEIAGQLGITGVDNLTKFTEVAAKMGVTTNLSGEEAATAFARIFNIMGEDFDNVDRMGAAVVDLGNNFATTEQEITQFVTRIAGAGKVAGLSTADILGISTAFSSIGVTAEAGGTAVQKVLFAMTEAANGATGGVVDNTKAIADGNAKYAELKTKLDIACQKQREFTDSTKESTRMANQAQIDKYSKELAALDAELVTLNATNGQTVISQGEFAKVLRMTNKEFQNLMKDDPAQVFQKFVTALGDAGGEAMSILDDLDLSDARLKRGFVGLAQNSKLLTDAISRGNTAWEENVALNEEAAKRFSTTESKIQVFKNTLHDIAISVGGELKKSLDSLLDAIQPILKQVNSFVKEHPQFIASILAIGTAVAGAGVAFTTLGGIVKAWGVLVTGVFGSIPGYIIIVIAALTLLYEGWQTNFLGIRDLINTVLASIEIFSRSLAGLDPLTKDDIENRRKQKASYKELNDEIDEYVNKNKEVKTSIDNNISTKKAEIEQAKTYIDRLRAITDENGNVKKGYEDEAKELANLINKIIPDSIKIRENNAGVIAEETAEIDKKIQKLQEEIALEGLKEHYIQAIKQQAKTYRELGKALQQASEQEAQLNEKGQQIEATAALVKKAVNIFPTLVPDLYEGIGNVIFNGKNAVDYSGMRAEYFKTQKSIDTLTKSVEDNTYIIDLYQKAITGDADTRSQALQQYYSTVAETSDGTLEIVRNTDQNILWENAGYQYALTQQAADYDQTRIENAAKMLNTERDIYSENYGKSLDDQQYYLEDYYYQTENGWELRQQLVKKGSDEERATLLNNQNAEQGNYVDHWSTIDNIFTTKSSENEVNNQNFLTNLLGVKQAYAADIESEEDSMWTDVNNTNKTKGEEYATQTGTFAETASTNFTTKGTSLIEKAVTSLMGLMPGYGENTAKSYGEKLAETLKKSGPGGVLSMIADALSKLRQLFESHSPPKFGPLKEIDTWGENLGKTWAESFVDGLEQGMSEAEDFLDKEGQRLLAASQASTLMGSGYSNAANSYAYNNTFNFNVPTASPYEIERAARRAMYLRR